LRRAFAASALFLACSAQQAPPGSHGVATPVGLDAGLALARAKPAPETDEVSLERFQPLLAEPALAKAQKLLDAGNPAAAAREVQAQMAKAEPAGLEVARWQMLLGRLREQAGDLPGAIASYELAAAEPWPLAGYAALGVGRVQLRAGKIDRAIQWLEKVPKDQPLASDARLLLAEAAVRAGRPDLAIDT
jgi:tetratricopeptide (TPR) repeat protein